MTRESKTAVIRVRRPPRDRSFACQRKRKRLKLSMMGLKTETGSLGFNGRVMGVVLFEPEYPGEARPLEEFVGNFHKHAVVLGG